MGIRVSRFIKEQWLNVDEAEKADILGKDLVVKRVYQKRVSNEDKLVLVFDDVQRHMLLNQTNLRAMLEGCGGVDDASEWIGAHIQLYVDDDVQVKDQTFAGLRLEVTSWSPRKAGDK